jgi:hypothetical protein
MMETNLVSDDEDMDGTGGAGHPSAGVGMGAAANNTGDDGDVG